MTTSTIPTSPPGATAQPYHLPAGDGPALWHLGALLTFKATSQNTGEQLWLQEVYGAYGYATPLHRHTREDEAFYMISGSMAIYVGDDVITAEPGSFIWAPRDITHAFCVESDEARFLALSTGGVTDRFFFETGEPAPTPTLPPPPETPPDIDRLVQVMGEYGVEMIGPPPEPRTKR
jgi:quercetin dioxygenase-like cupin family protein